MVLLQPHRVPSLGALTSGDIPLYVHDMFFWSNGWYRLATRVGSPRVAKSREHNKQ